MCPNLCNLSPSQSIGRPTKYHKHTLVFMLTTKASSHIDDTIRQHATRPVFFRSPQNQMDQFTYMQHYNVWSSQQKAAGTVSRKLLKKTASIGISPGLINL